MESGHTSSMRGAIKSEQEDPDLETMADRLAFQAQIASVIEILANSAVVEICKLVDDGYTALRCQMDQERERSRKENDVLRHKLQEMDVKIQSYERKLKKCDQSAAQRSKGAQDPWEETPPTITVLHTSVFSSASPPSQSSHSPSRPEVKPLKLLSNKLRSREVKTPGTVGKDFTESLPDSPLKEPKIQTDETTYDELHPPHPSVPVELDEPSPDHFKNLGLDQAWMQERVSSLGATYAVAQLGLRNTSSRHASSSSLSQGETDGVDDPLTSLYTDGTHTISALITSFDVSVGNAAVVAAPPPPPPSLSTDSSANTPNQTQPVRSSAALAKDPVVCAVCRCVFSTVAALKLHRRLHIGDRPYTCPHCGKGFAQPNNLRVHLLVHTGERRYHCTLCGKSFISSSHLKRHHTVHTQEKPYSCSRCGQSFSQMCSVRRHRQQSQCGL